MFIITSSKNAFFVLFNIVNIGEFSSFIEFIFFIIELRSLSTSEFSIINFIICELFLINSFFISILFNIVCLNSGKSNLLNSSNSIIDKNL